MTSFIADNVRWILEEFENKRIKYSVLRNYEDLPEISHDLDLVCQDSDINKVREVLKVAKIRFNWDECIEINLWSSYVADYSIRVFKFFDFDRNVCLQIDFFGGFTICSAPAICVNSLLERSVKKDFYYKINNLDEILMRSMQLSCAIRDHQTARVIKIERVISNLGGVVALKQAYELLEVDMDLSFLNHTGNSYKKGFERFKLKYFLNSLKHSPLKTIFRLLERVRFRLKMVTFSIPGVIFFLNKKSLHESSQYMTTELKSWVDGNIVTGYLVLSKWNLSSLKEAYRVVCKGGMLIVATNLIHQKYDPKLMKKVFLKKYKL